MNEETLNIDKMDFYELVAVLDRVLVSDNPSVKRLLKKLIFLMLLAGDNGDTKAGPIISKLDAFERKSMSQEMTINLLHQMLSELQNKQKSYYTRTTSASEIYPITTSGGWSYTSNTTVKY
jgi:hypothetical protein